MDAVLVQLVRERAEQRCEYCQLPQIVSSIPFEIDHVISRKHRGLTSPENLAFSCFYCNSYKGPNIAGLNPITGELCRLYHPRSDHWGEHFKWDSSMLVGLTAIGRTTILVLGSNDADAVRLCASLIREGMFPQIQPPA